MTNIVEAQDGKEFPQTSTIFQSYELEEFETHRHLGYLMGWAYMSKLELSETELTPTATCKSL